MPFSSMILEMKGEIGAISRRGLRSRSHRPGRVTRVAAVEPDQATLRQSCWTQLPPELLREVLARVEEAEARWPGRRDVVACAGVCRNWRDVVKEIVRTPEASGKLTFPISVKQPGPRDAPIKCFIRRDRCTQTYHLCIGLTDALADDGKFLLSARKYRRPSCSEFLISLDVCASKGNGTYIGKLRSNFLGTKFTVYDAHPPCGEAMISKGRSSQVSGSTQISSRVPAGNYPVSHISYELNVMGSRGPRKMTCIMDSISASATEEGGNAPTQTEFPSTTSHSFAPGPFFRSKSGLPNTSTTSRSSAPAENKMVLKNKSPRWHEHLQCWCLNFHGRVTVASVKNFQLVASDAAGGGGLSNQEENDDVVLQFGKVGKDLFTMDYRYPVSAFQAFAICLSSFETKIACE